MPRSSSKVHVCKLTNSESWFSTPALSRTPPRLLEAPHAAAFESTPSMFGAKTMFGHTLKVQTAVRTNNNVLYFVLSMDFPFESLIPVLPSQSSTRMLIMLGGALPSCAPRVRVTSKPFHPLLCQNFKTTIL